MRHVFAGRRVLWSYSSVSKSVEDLGFRGFYPLKGFRVLGFVPTKMGCVSIALVSLTFLKLSTGNYGAQYNFDLLGLELGPEP